MPKLDVIYPKRLKLTNVLAYSIPLDAVDNKLALLIKKMENYIKSKGYAPIGPIIQCAIIGGDSQIQLTMMRQSSGFIQHCDSEYSMHRMMVVPNCYYLRYNGLKKNIDIAYDKLRVYAYENDKELKGDIYTVYLNDKDDSTLLDIFMPIVSGNI